MKTKFKKINKEKVKEKVKVPKSRKRKFSNFSASLSGDSELATYTKGAFVGGLVGGIGGLFIGRRIILGIIIGSLAGGYIAYELNK